MGASDILSDEETPFLPSGPTMRGRTSPRDGRLRAGDVVLGRYTVLAELGEGGMGVVYRCLDSVGGIEVALKCLPPELSRDEAEMADFRENYSIVARLHHSSISGLRNLEKDPGSGECFLVMDLAEGEDLSAILRRRRGDPMPLADALAILRPLADALDYAHAERVLHRDVKPANVKVGARVQLLDFGLAAEARSSMSRVSRRGHSGASGTPSYMAPEQWEARVQGPATDQYALAVVAYQMLAGHLPFDADDPDLLRRAVLSREPDPVPGLPRGANAALARALAKDPAARFPSCAAFVGALEGKGVGSRTTGRRRALATAAAALGALAVVALGALLVARSGDGGAAGTDSRAETAETDSHAESAETDSHAEFAESAEPDSHAESAETAETDSRAEDARVEPEVVPLAGGAKSESHAEEEDGGMAKSPDGSLSAERPSPPVPKSRQTIVKSTKAARPLLVVNATLDGKPVSSGAKLVVRGKSYELNRPIDCSTVSTFGPGEVSLERDGKVYVGSFPRISVSWSGRKPVSVRLAEWKEHPPAARTTVHVDDVEIALRWCPAGSFRMGSPDGDREADMDERPQISVDVPRGFWMGETEVTQALWRKFMEDAPPNGYKGDDYPMEFMSWSDCMAIVAKLNGHPAVKKAGLRFAIPTEAQWEYACRAGGAGDYGRTKDGETEDLGRLGWYDGNSGSSVMPVARKDPNAWGIHDMHGNVCEWCANVYSGHPDATLDNAGATKAAGEYRILRGGNSSNTSKSCRAADRSPALPNHRLRYRGFRLAAFPDGR